MQACDFTEIFGAVNFIIHMDETCLHDETHTACIDLLFKSQMEFNIKMIFKTACDHGSQNNI